jgi:hypothetical protein
MNKELDEYRQSNDDDTLSNFHKLKTVISATKPGPGWVEVTPDIVAKLEISTVNIRNAVKKLKDMMTHTGST